ncbi:TonB-dependent receptor [Shewanella yunxiaonensis]|uniref:TonB-dependent receptor n=1 Tax=Shewanella yunxiaonensis TaxID=2829809 RepID=A0ABX7YST2_9GAMM|nr:MULTISPECIES: TonB-dependent receptor [Shewanella]MDF0534119.1 TonB-dependent receptor [Shewanella sp. A32]QUN05435.1 TonB-dependent receptor [Shewanella yunxiaonensis]
MQAKTHNSRTMRHNYLTVCVVAILATGAGVSSMTHSAYAKTQTAPANNMAQYAFDIPSGTLPKTLQQIKHVSGENIIYDQEKLSDVSVPALHGTYTIQQALEIICAKNSLVIVKTDAGWSLQLPQDMEKVTVYGSQNAAEKSFQVTRSETATRFGVDLQDLPQSITVITSQVLETQQNQTVQSALMTSGGVSTQQGSQGSSSFRIRGFGTSGMMYNGVANSSATATNVNAVERIEILKGPQSILSGASSMGGSVNIVPKKPTSTPIRKISAVYATNNDLGGSVDLSQPLTDDGKLSTRFIGAKSKATESYGDFDKGRESKFAQWGLRWNDDKTDFYINGSYDKNFAPQAPFTVAQDGKILAKPTMRVGTPDAGVGQKATSFLYSFEYALNDWATIVSRAQYSKADTDLNVFLTYGQLAPNTYLTTNTNNESSITTFSGDHYLRLSVDTGPVEHRISTGINHMETKNTSDYYDSAFELVDLYATEQYDFQPTLRNDETHSNIVKISAKQVGAFFQDLVGYKDVYLSLGVRRDRYLDGPSDVINLLYPNYSSTVGTKKTYKTTPSVGLLYAMNENLSFYGTYSEGYIPQNTSRPNCADGTYGLPAKETRNKEVGVKLQTNDGKFSVTSSAYQIQETNTLSYDSLEQCYNVQDARQVKGMELEAQGSPLDGLNMIFSYTYTDVTDVNDPDYYAAAISAHKASLWSNYQLPFSELSDFGVGFGVTAYSSSRMGYTATAAEVPGGARVDVGVYYDKKPWQVRLNVNNLFDRTLYGVTTTEVFVPIEPQRNMSLSVSYNF